MITVILSFLVSDLNKLQSVKFYHYGQLKIILENNLTSLMVNIIRIPVYYCILKSVKAFMH